MYVCVNACVRLCEYIVYSIPFIISNITYVWLLLQVPFLQKDSIYSNQDYLVVLFHCKCQCLYEYYEQDYYVWMYWIVISPSIAQISLSGIVIRDLRALFLRFGPSLQPYQHGGQSFSIGHKQWKYCP